QLRLQAQLGAGHQAIPGAPRQAVHGELATADPGLQAGPGVVGEEGGGGLVEALAIQFRGHAGLAYYAGLGHWLGRLAGCGLIPRFAAAAIVSCRACCRRPRSLHRYELAMKKPLFLVLMLCLSLLVGCASNDEVNEAEMPEAQI